MPSHALLLRLFLSPSFFSVHVALRYLLLYADNIGITYYLTSRLRQLDTQELREIWGFICHLLVARPSRSRALECFVVEIAQRSTHIAMMTLWFMQASLKDFSPQGDDSHSFAVCQRVLHICHEIIFSDPPARMSAPYGALNIHPLSRFSRQKVKQNIQPAVVGAGLVLAGAPALPQLTELMGQVAIEQGRIEEERTPALKNSENEDVSLGFHSTQSSTNDDDEDEDLPDSDDNHSVHVQIEDAPKLQPISRRRIIGAAQTVPTLPLHLQRPWASKDPLGQLDAHHVILPYLSTPSISSARTPRSAMNRADSLLEAYDPQTQVQLLRSHYCHSEVQFLLSLEDICNRLVVIPRPARVSALRAELMALNHKLPAELCMPLWCFCSDSPSPPKRTQPHHRIVRIPPGECVVLNSAERAPYLIVIEILHDDLDFEPTTRNNKEVLKKLVVNIDERQSSSRISNPFGNLLADRPKLELLSTTNNEPETLQSPTLTTPTFPEDEEIDVVEQLYGSGDFLRSRTVDLSESIVLPPPPKNRELELAAWSQSSQSPSMPSAGNASSSTQNSPAPLHVLPSDTSKPSPQDPLDIPESPKPLSLDEYSERMRTAAIMLAQLNTSLTREHVIPAPNTTPQPTSGRNWLFGSRWLNFDQQQAVQSTSHSSNPDRTHYRIKLQHMEATAIRDRIMKEMLALEKERMQRMQEHSEDDGTIKFDVSGSIKSAEDENIIRRELNKVDPSAVVFSESWASKKTRIRHSSPYGHLANWDCVPVIVKTGGDLRQEQLAVQLVQEFQRIWEEEKCLCWVRYFRILITGGASGLVETITDAVSIHSIKKAEYARRLAEGRLGHVTLFDHFKATYGDPSSAKFTRAQRNFVKSLAGIVRFDSSMPPPALKTASGYSIVTYLLQIKDRHNGNILLDRDGHLIHIDFGFILSNTPGNIGFEAAPFKLPTEYIEVLGGVNGTAFLEFRRLFREGFEAARKHCDRIITLVELMQKRSSLPCFAAFGEQTSVHLRERFQPALTHSLVGDYVDRLIDSSLESHWTRLYDSYQYYSQSIL